MKGIIFVHAWVATAISVLLAGRGQKVRTDPRLEYPPPPEVEHEQGADLVRVFHGQREQVHAAVPGRFCISLTGIGSMRHRTVTRSAPWRRGAGKIILPWQQEIVSGIRPGDRMFTNALSLQNSAEQ
jgi:hypothetical protein